MNKVTFLESLHSRLSGLDIDEQVKQDIIEDYQLMIEEAVDNGIQEEDFISRLGSPQSIAKSLKFERRKEKVKESKWVAISPFVSVALYMILGFVYNAWHPGWLVFFLIPVMGVLLGTDEEERVVALSPFVSITVFMLLGTYFNLWHPAWLLFFLIPLLGSMYAKNHKYRYIGMVAFGVIPLVYLGLDLYNTSVWNGLIFLITLFLIVYSGMIQIGKGHFSFDVTGSMTSDELQTSRKQATWYLLGTVVLIGGYIVFNLYFNIWHPSWLIFIIIPLIRLLFVKGDKELPVVVYMPFISTILFVLIGEIWNIYHLSWLVFFLIPISAILIDKE